MVAMEVDKKRQEMRREREAERSKSKDEEPFELFRELPRTQMK
jgi:hypothetical protein